MGRRIGWVLLLALVLPLGAPPTPARAHAHLVQATPPAGAVLGTAPARIDLVFDEELDEKDSRIRVYDASDARVDRDDVQVAKKRMTVGVRDLPTGTYRVAWRSVADDDKGVIQDRYTFRIGGPAPGQPQLAVSPDHSDAGQLVTIAGSGFTPNGTVVVAIGDEQDALGAPRADGQGRFALQTLVPEYLPHGRQVILALDLDDHMGTAALQIDRGGWPPLGVRVSVETDGNNRVNVEIRVVNLSGWHLRRIDVRAMAPPGTRALADGLEGPEGVDGKLEEGAVRWRNANALPHQMLDAFTCVLDTSGRQPGTAVPTPNVTVTFEHGGPPLFRGQATAP